MSRARSASYNIRRVCGMVEWNRSRHGPQHGEETEKKKRKSRSTIMAVDGKVGLSSGGGTQQVSSMGRLGEAGHEHMITSHRIIPRRGESEKKNGSVEEGPWIHSERKK